MRPPRRATATATAAPGAPKRRAKVAAKRAKVLGLEGQAKALAYVATRRYAARNRVMLMLSFKAGLRAMEIAGIERRHVLGSDGEVAEAIYLPDYVCKKGSGREVPMAPDLRQAIAELLDGETLDWPMNAPLCLSERALCPRQGDGEDAGPILHRMTPHAVSKWFGRIYRACGLEGASSHSGRRTFITAAARAVAKVGGSLRDVQELAGHTSMNTTQAYIQGDSEAKRRLVALI